MSDLDLPCERPLPQGQGKSFKGVENFLKRVAFNLGNTPSRTEVKIISCIPIDVSDLQQRIIYLEKQLEEAKLGDDHKSTTSSQKPVVNTVLCDSKYPLVSHAGVSCNKLEMDKGTNPYNVTISTKKKSNVSFAVPSAHHSNINSSSSHQYAAPYTAQERYADIMGYDNDLKPFTVGEIKQNQGRKKFLKKKKKAFRHNRSKSQYIYYAQASSSPFDKTDVVEDMSRNNKTVAGSYMANVIDKQYKPRVLGANLSEISTFSTPVCRDTLDLSTGHGTYESDICSCCHGAFHNIDNQPIVYHNPQVYRADTITTNGEFYDSTFYDVIPVKEKPVKINKPLETFKKREQKASVDIMCWPEDVRAKHQTYPIYNPLYLDYTTILPSADNCSKKTRAMNQRELTMRNLPRRRANMDKLINMEMSKSSCIDFGNVYSKVVKKKTERINRCLHTDKYLKPTDVRHKVDAECLTVITNNSECQTIISNTNTKDSIQSNDDKTEETLNQIKTILQSVLHEVKVSSLTKSTTDEKPKKDATVQKGVSQGTMPVQFQGNLAGPGLLPGSLQANMPGPVQENIPRLIQDNGTLPDTITGIPQSNVVEGLQTSLTGNMQGSRLLNSFTYSPYDIPPYLPSCSKQMNPNQFYYSQSPLKCFQNFPLIVQNQGQPTCASCFRHSSHVKRNYGKQATTIATNTDCMKVEHSKETEKLIKEIYKSMALTMGAVKKENSSEYEPLHDFSSHLEKSSRTIIEKPTPVKEFKKVTNVVQAVSELFRKRDMQASSESRNFIECRFGSRRSPMESRYGSHNTTTSTETESKQISTDTAIFSGLTTTNTDLDAKLRKDRANTFLDQSKREQAEATRQDKNTFQTRTQNKHAVVELSSLSSSGSDTDDTCVPQETKQATQTERKEKTSLFSKMFKSVKLFKPRERQKRDKAELKVEQPSSEESSTDSDYQTVYSQKIETIPKHRPRAYNLGKRRTHSKISYKHVYQRDKSPEKLLRRPPYMEQEYRRYWNEKLMFHGDNKYQNHSDHRHAQRYIGELDGRYNPYYQTYEARPVIVERTKPIPRRVPVNTRRILIPKQIKMPSGKLEGRIASNAMPWLKKHRVGRIRCGEHFRQLIKDN